MHRSQKMQYREVETFCENLPCRKTRPGSMFVTAEGNASQGGRDAVIVVGQTRAREIASGLSQRAARLPWAQEAPGSNPGAPTKTSRVFSLGY